MNHVEQERIRAMATPELVRYVLAEGRELMKAEVHQAKAELKVEALSAARAAAFLGAAAGLSLSGLALFLVALALSLPTSEVVGCLLVGGAALLVAVLLAYLGYRRLPLKPMSRSQESVRRDLAITRGAFG